MAGRSSLLQAGIYLIRLISRSCFFNPSIFRPAIARRYTIWPPHRMRSNGSQELLTHLRVTHFGDRLRFFHPQRTVYLWQFFSAHSVGQKTKIAHHPEKLLRNMLFQARHHFTLRQRFRSLLTRIMVVVAEA